jgi:hypothetical protein
LIRKDYTESTDKESGSAIVSPLKAVIEMLLKRFSGKDDSSAHSWQYYSITRQQSRIEDLVHLYNTISDFCYSIGQVDLVRHQLQIAVQDPIWSSSPALLGVIAKQAAKDAADGVKNPWSVWFAQQPEQATCRTSTTEGLLLRG